MTATDQHPLLHRAANTPARDWLRGRITGRLDWRSVIARADLPTPIAELVTRVVRRSRLWRLEKADLAAELSAHFADGLSSGSAPEHLMQDFGHPRRAARLIRRATRRKRHWTARAFTHTCQGIGMVILAGAIAYALLAWRFYSGEPNIARNYTAEYNETIEQIPEEDRAWDIYIESYALLESFTGQPPHGWPSIAPEHPRYGEALEYLDRQRDVVELVHTAAARPCLGAHLSDALDPRLIEADNARNPGADRQAETPSENPMLITVLLPELGHMRILARLLTFDAHVAARAGESDRAVRDITSMLGIAEHAAERPILIGDLVGIAIEQLAIRTTGALIGEYPDLFTDDQLRELAHHHAGFMGGEPAIDFIGERWFFEDVVQRVYTDDGNGDGHITAEGLKQLMSLGGMTSGGMNDFGPSPLAPITAALVADRADMTAKYDEFMTQMERNVGLPMWEYDTRGTADVEIEMLSADPIKRVRYFPIVILLPALDKASQAAEHAKQGRDGLLAGIALELHRREHGRYPESLDALVPAYLPTVPPDRFNGEPMSYALADGRARLWSVGADRNDDGGAPPADDHGDESRWTPEAEAAQNERTGPERYDGDWILWPITYELVTAEPQD